MLIRDYKIAAEKKHLLLVKYYLEVSFVLELGKKHKHKCLLSVLEFICILHVTRVAKNLFIFKQNIIIIFV